jgi:electron transfer flavoprotein-quinone oxidoreductase
VLGIDQDRINALAKAKQAASLPELVAQFESRPEIQRYIKGAELKEYSAHVITEAGINGISRLSMPGMLVVGDAAGFALNMGVTVRGMEFAIASGVTAAEVVDEALKKGDFSSQSLSLYDRRMKESFVIKDMETFRHSRDILENPRLFTVYPRFISNLLGAVFEVNSEPKKGLYRTASEIARTYVANWEGFKDFLSFRKV